MEKQINMSSAMKYYNHFELESVLKNANTNFDNFYKYELIEMLNIARKLINSDDKLTYEQGYTAGFNHNVEIVENLEKEKKDLIRYLEDKIKEHLELMNSSEYESCQILELTRCQAYQDILERLKSDKYE